jgi:hypothetical protein
MCRVAARPRNHKPAQTDTAAGARRKPKTEIQTSWPVARGIRSTSRPRLTRKTCQWTVFRNSEMPAEYSCDHAIILAVNARLNCAIDIGSRSLRCHDVASLRLDHGENDEAGKITL